MRYVTYKTPARAGVEFFMIFSLFGFIAGGLTGTTGGCKTLSPEAKQNILSAEKVACGLANAFLSDPQITALCNFADQETAPILNLVSQHRVALAKSHAVGVTEGRASGATGSSLTGACAPTSGGASSVTPLKDGGTADAAKDAK